MKTCLRSCLPLLLLAASHKLHAQGTAFSYQGRLNDGTNPAVGIYDLRFAIYDSLNAGTLQGSPLTNAATGVSNGFFTATLNPGAGVFTGADRWLEIGVRTNGGGLFAILSPRQKLTPTPYAMFAQTVGSNGLAAGTYASAVALNNPANSFSGSFSGGFNGNAGGLTNLPLREINVLDSGALASYSGNSDCSAAFSNAFKKALLSRLPIHLPNTTNHFAYYVSNTIVVDMSDGWDQGTASPFVLKGDHLAHVIMGRDVPFVRFTNSMNNIRIEGIWLTGVGSATSTNCGFSFDGAAAAVDNLTIRDCVIEGFYRGIYGNYVSISQIEDTLMIYNNYPFWFDGFNNSLTFSSSAFVINRNGGYLNRGNQIVFFNCEGGGTNPNEGYYQTNYLTIDGTAAVSIYGGNNEQYGNSGAIKLVGVGGARLNLFSFGSLSFGDNTQNYLVNDQSSGSPNYIVIAGSVGGNLFYADSTYGFVQKRYSAKNFSDYQCKIITSATTNYLGNDQLSIGNQQAIPIAVSSDENHLRWLANADGKGRTYLLAGTLSNNVTPQLLNLTAHAYEVADGTLIRKVNGPFMQLTAAHTMQNVYSLGITRYWRGESVSDAGGGNYVPYAMGWMSEAGLGYNNFALQLETNGNADVWGQVHVGQKTSSPGQLQLSVQTNAPSITALGNQPAAMMWVSNGTVYVTYSLNGSDVATKRLAP